MTRTHAAATDDDDDPFSKYVMPFLLSCVIIIIRGKGEKKKLLVYMF